ncbi:MAG TPA: type ISP restriction/modification enzyme [Chitinophagales bacterium]|nr:type ISP restriction/modification enzyme [Chitinophagales bacterium]
MNQEFLITQDLFKQITETKYICQSDFIDRNDIETLINLDRTTINQIVQKTGLTFVPANKHGNLCFATNNDELQDDFKLIFTSIDLLDYISAVLHARIYGEQNKEFKNIDSIGIPYPEDAKGFWQFVRLGKEIKRQQK